ncbi:Gcn5-related n-acetyltransferase-like protein [Globisporangium polare]
MINTTSPNEDTSATSSPRITVREFRPEDHAQVVALFREGMLFYTPETSHPQHSVWVDYVAQSLKADLADIPGHYMRGDGSNFFVATAPTSTSEGEQEEVVGTLGLEHKSDQEGVAELRRVSVKASHRRFGIGRLLMAHVTQWAKSHERRYSKLALSNAATQYVAHKFYYSLGYTLTTTSVFCQEPYFELTHFEKEI